MSLEESVKAVSRSFALSLLWLPKPQRRAVSLAYLLARFADTLADSGSWTLDERLSHLALWENAILQRKSEIWKLSSNTSSFQAHEAALISRGRELLNLFLNSDSHHQSLCADVVKILIEGMKWDLKTFSVKGTQIYGCADASVFDWYTFTIAGCVGAYWVRTFGLSSDLEGLAVDYGKALQRINILRDAKEDWQRGRVYFSRSELAARGLERGEPWRQAGWRDFCTSYLQSTRTLLMSGVEFCDLIPRDSIRLRFASLMPMMIGFETLHALESANSWEEPIKISRRRVQSLAIVALAKSVLRTNITPWARKYLR